MQLLWLNLWVYLSSAFSNYNLSPLRGQYSLLRMQELESKAHAEHDAYELYLALRNTSATDPKLGTAIHSALDVLDNTLRLYGPDNVYSSYNGGKDAVVIMHLLRASVAKYSKETGVTHSPLLVYFAVNDEFPEVINYIEETEELYGLRVQRSNSSIIKGLNEIIQAKKETGGDHQQHLAFVLGTRKGDPNCGDQSFFSPSSSWMPPFMRVNPIIGWTYGQVWDFLRTFNLSYCKLYDQGYTSLGKQADTQRNPALRKNKYIDRRGEQDSEQVGDFYPAYMLADWSLERAGRGMTEAKSGKRMVEGRMDVSSAGMIIIGDEILNGFTSDSNLLITSTALGNVGVPLRRVVVVSDDEEEISREIRRMSQEFDLVITSGGIGPTHDDVTIKAVATAFGESIEANPLMLDHLDKAHTASGSKEPMRSSFLRLADLPSKSQLRFPPPTGNESRLMWPILQYDNVFVLPGVPEFFADKIATITRHFIIPRKSFFSRKIVLSIEEKDIVGALDDAVAAHPRVKFGSYPFVNRTDYKTILTVQGEEEEEVEAAVNQLLEAIPAQAVVSVLGSLL